MRRFISFMLLLIAGAAPSWATEPVVSLQPIIEGVWRHISWQTFDDGSRYFSNGLIVQDGDTLTLIDSAWGDTNTELLLDEIEAQIGLPIVRAVATHAHPDRAAGADILKVRGIEFYALAETRRLAVERGMIAPELTLDMPFEAGATLALGPLEVMYPGAGHATDNLLVWLPKQKLLFGGCAVRPGDAKGLGYYEHGDPTTWGAAMTLAKARYGGAKIVVPGHGDVGGITLLDHTAALVKRHLAKAR